MLKLMGSTNQQIPDIKVLLLTFKGVFAKNERGYAIKKRFWSPLILVFLQIEKIATYLDCKKNLISNKSFRYYIL